ncbi:MAG: hypothetical protein K8R69_06485 [Deltaproteobacteria bacterium]|nr:hypothetical protein [Deltaproteobacteria bacterium]
MRHPQLEILLRWLRNHPGLFSSQEEGDDLGVLETFSGKSLKLRSAAIQAVEERSNSANPAETYVLILWDSGRQLVLSNQGFAFPPDFTNTGPIPTPSQVYCMQDYQNLMNRLRHVAAEAERGREALEIIMFLISLLDGARVAGLEVDKETQEVEDILSLLERGETLPPPH